MKKLSIFFIVLAAFTAGANAANALKWINVFDAVKTVQEDSSLEYRTKTGVGQTLNIPPGIYKISVQKLRQ